MKCPNCGKEFVPKDKRQKYCSVECRKERKRRKNRIYMQTHKEQMKITRRIWRRKNRNKENEYNRNFRKKRYVKARKLIGDTCIICGSKDKIKFHEIYGKSHYGYETSCYILNHKEDFIPLCRDCHRAIHQLAGKQIKLKKLLELLRLLNCNLF